MLERNILGVGLNLDATNGTKLFLFSTAIIHFFNTKRVSLLSQKFFQYSLPLSDKT